MTRAAQALGVTQPALSAMIKKLESEVGAPLLHRTGRGVELTEAGQTFLVHAEDAIRAAESGVKAVRQLVGLEAGSIRVGGGATATAYLLPPVVSEIRSAHPNLRFYVREGGSSAIAAAVLSGELDLGIVTLPVELPGSADLMTSPLVDDELRLVVPPSMETLRRGGFRWKDVQALPMIAFEAGSAVRELIDRSAADAGVTLNVVMELRSIESIKRMVLAGIGVALVSRFAIGPDSGLGMGLACRDGPLTRRLAIARRRDRVPSPGVAVFERALVGRLRAQ